MNSILLVRHAETDMVGTFCGHSDPGLSERGHGQLPALLAGLSQMLPRAGAPILFTSDLRRAVQTADVIASHLKTTANPRPSLREIYFGEWEGLTWNEIEARDTESARRWMAEYPNRAAPRGELWELFCERISLEAAFLKQAAEESPLIVVTHGGVMRTLLQHHFGISEPQAWHSSKHCGAIVVANASDDRESQSNAEDSV